jgi:hypothetical protein
MRIFVLGYFNIALTIPAKKPITMSLSNKLAITDVDLKGKRVLIRVCIP